MLHFVHQWRLDVIPNWVLGKIHPQWRNVGFSINISNEKWKRQSLTPTEKRKYISKVGRHPKMYTLCLVEYEECCLLWSDEPKWNIQYREYCQHLETLYKDLHKKHPSLVRRKGMLFLHDNSRPHNTQVTEQKTMVLNIQVLPHPP